MTRRVALLAALALAAAAPAGRTAAPGSAMPSPGDVPPFWRTRAERSGFQSTPDYDETMRYVRQLEGASLWIRVESYGTSGQGRPLPLVIVSKDRAFTPAAARATGKPIVLIQNGIHAGEIEGKDASLALIRDLAVLRRRPELLDHAILLVLPIFSVDSHERRSRWNRINQNGPDEMGWRSTPIGLNLNRDYLKAETPEMRALLSRVYTQWWPHLLVDNHTTDGAEYRHDVTYAFNHGPGTPPSIVAWLTEAFEGRVVDRLAAMGHLPAPYLTFRRGNDPASGVEFDDSRPRYSTGYPPLHGRAAILVETHMRKPYETRVRATYDLMVALLEELNAHPAELPAAVAVAESAAVARGRERDPRRRAFVLTTKLAADSVGFPYKGVTTRWERSDITGSLVARYAATPLDTTVWVHRKLEPDLTVTQPVGYLVPQEWTSCREHLDVHAVRYRRFARAWSDSVEMERIVEWKQDPKTFEGHHNLTVSRIEVVRRLRTYRPGDLWVPLDQRSAAVAVQLLESQAPDGLALWNAFDTVLESKEYAEDYVMEPIARDMLRRDPVLAREFQAKLKSDPAFAADSAARVDFFFRRSPWADPEQGFHPVARALRAPPETVLAP